MEITGQIILGFLLGAWSLLYFSILFVIMFVIGQFLRGIKTYAQTLGIIIATVAIGYLIQIMYPSLLLNHPSLISKSQSFGLAFVAIACAMADWTKHNVSSADV
jgi:hypothetical protein